MKISFQVAVLLAMTALVYSPVHANGGDSGGGGRSSPLAPFQKLIEEKKYQQAVSELEKALATKPQDADLLNLMAFSHRQMKHYDVALDFYQKALEVNPKHRGANEYLGELYLVLGDLEKAEQRLSVLDDACFFGCDEYDELKEAIEKYRKDKTS